ncbi:MAG: hypothetical protein DAHOPDDO_03367 [Ignavibacteriaceae bacterium]|nr:hypothetical protein [Ignavibacteriaceae bacterium]
MKSYNKINYDSVSKLFNEGDVITSGGGKGRIKIREIVEHGVRFQSLTGSYKGLLRYTKLNVVYDNFNKIPGNQIEHNVFQLLIKNGLFDSTHETNLYGFVKEFNKRTKS